MVVPYSSFIIPHSRTWLCRGVLFLLVLLFSIVVIAPTHAYSSPGRPAGFVNDFAGILSPETRTALEQQLRAYEQKTTNEVVVVTIPALTDDTIEGYAVSLVEEWKIGKKGSDNGVLFLIARDDRQMRFEVGYGLEGVMNDAKAGRIIREAVAPAFRDGDYNSGITNGVLRLIAELSGEAPLEVSVATREKSSRGFINFVLEVGIFIIFGLFGTLGHFLGKTKSWWLGGVLGGAIGLIAAIWIASMVISGIVVLVLTLLGLLLDRSLSKGYATHHAGGHRPWWWGGGMYGGGGGSFGGGSFGGFGGGSSGGGGASGSW